MICAVAIVRDELPFLDEWLAYHHLLGIDHFFLYDDDPSLPLDRFLKPHQDYVTVIHWFGKSSGPPAQHRQLSAYQHALANIGEFSWVTFIDIDEFIVIRNHDNLRSFLHEHDSSGQISLHQYLFGHNGFYDDPRNLIITSLLRRRSSPVKEFKSICKVEAISDITNSQYCILRDDYIHVDINKREFVPALYRGKANGASVHHYMCRSFSRWMRRPERGSVTDDVLDQYPDDCWQHNKEQCLRRFVRTIAKGANEYCDRYMLKYEPRILRHIRSLNIHAGRAFKGRAFQLRVKQSRTCPGPNAMVVYTAICGGYDKLREQPSDNVPFIAFVDGAPSSAGWNVMPLVPTTADANRNAKRYKVLSHQYFPDWQYTLWIDGSVVMRTPGQLLVDEYLQDYDMVVHRHPNRNCAYAEADVCRVRYLDNPEIINAQMARYRLEGYPTSAGLYEMPVILRRNNDRVRAFNEVWWSEIERGSKRDQLSAVYAARKVGLRVGHFPGSLHDLTPDYNHLFYKMAHTRIGI